MNYETGIRSGTPGRPRGFERVRRMVDESPHPDPGVRPLDERSRSDDALSDAELVEICLGRSAGGADDTDPRPATGRESLESEQAFALLVERYSRLVFKIAYGKANDREDAEDICQDVFLHAHRSLPRIRDPQAFLGWLMAITHNRANRYCRTRASRRRRLDVARDEARIEADRQAREQHSVVEKPEETVTDAVRDLPDDYRNALQWKYVDGLSYEEIGDRLAMSFHQVDYLLRKAKRALKANVEKSRAQGERSRDDLSV